MAEKGSQEELIRLRIPREKNLNKLKILPKIKPSLNNYPKKPFLVRKSPVLPPMPTVEQSRAARALGFTPSQLADGLAKAQTANSLETVTVVTRDGHIARLPVTLPGIRGALRLHNAALERELQAEKQRAKDATLSESRRLQEIMELKYKHIKRNTSFPKVYGISSKSPWTVGQGPKPLRRGKR